MNLKPALVLLSILGAFIFVHPGTVDIIVSFSILGGLLFVVERIIKIGGNHE